VDKVAIGVHYAYNLYPKDGFFFGGNMRPNPKRTSMIIKGTIIYQTTFWATNSIGVNFIVNL
jgi:hypothetical protein